MKHKEMTKIVLKQCDCGKMLQVLCNETANIQAVRCNSCLTKWYEDNKQKG